MAHSEQQFCLYIKNAGGMNHLIPVDWFDEDYEPAGKMIRDRLYKAGLIEYSTKYMYLTVAGEEACS